MHMEVLHISCNMCTHDLPDMYALSPWAYISGKSLVPMLQLLHVKNHSKFHLFIRIFITHKALKLNYSDVYMYQIGISAWITPMYFY